MTALTIFFATLTVDSVFIAIVFLRGTNFFAGPKREKPAKLPKATVRR